MITVFFFDADIPPNTSEFQQAYEVIRGFFDEFNLKNLDELFGLFIFNQKKIKTEVDGSMYPTFHVPLSANKTAVLDALNTLDIDKQNQFSFAETLHFTTNHIRNNCYGNVLSNFIVIKKALPNVFHNVNAENKDVKNNTTNEKENKNVLLSLNQKLNIVVINKIDVYDSFQQHQQQKLQVQKEELQQICLLENLKLATLNGGSFFHLYFKDDGFLDIDLPNSALRSIVKNEYVNFNCEIHFGKLNDEVRLFPRVPHILSFGQLYSLPSTVTIRGFLASKTIGSPPYASRHVITPKQLSDMNKPNFRMLLFQCLVNKDLTAVVKLGPDWFGFIAVSLNEKKERDLNLYVLEPAIYLPWIGNLETLSFEKVNEDSVENKVSVPLPPHATPSFDPESQEKGNIIYYPHNNILQSNISKCFRYMAKLPSKPEQFFGIVNKIVIGATSFRLYDFLEQLTKEFDKHASNQRSSNPEAYKLIMEGKAKIENAY